MIKFVIVPLEEKDAEEKISKLFNDHGGDINRENIFSFQDRVGFIVNTDTEEVKGKKMTVNSLKRENRSLAVRIVSAEKALHFSKKKAEEGKDEDGSLVASSEEALTDLIAERDYNADLIEKIQAELNA